MKTEEKEARLGRAKIVLEISDRHGLTVHHGTDGELLASKPPEKCAEDDWEALWAFLEGVLGVKRGL